MADIKQYIKSKRESLSASSITTYASVLRSLYKKVFGEGDIDFKKFDDTKTVLDYLADLPPNKRKTILSALVIITDNKKYRDQMLEDVREYNKEISLQQKSDAQKESWVETDEIKTALADAKRSADALFKKKTHTPADLQVIQNYIILCMLSGEYIPVRRSKDYCDFKIRNATENDNYIDGKELVFNSYKTKKTYGQQRIPLPVKLKNILKKWIDINPTDYLLFDANFNPLSSVKLNQRLNKIFDGKKVGVNGLRHSIITEKFADVHKKNKEAQAYMEAAGSSGNMLTTYVKDE